MPTINSMVQRNNLLADVSYRYFKLDTDASENSVLVGGAIKTNADFLKSDFSGQPAITELVENYNAEKEDFHNNIQDKLEALQESTERLKNSVQVEEENQAAAETSNATEDTSSSSSAKTSGEEKTVGSTLSTLGNFAKNNVPPRAKILAFQPVEKNNRQQEKETAEKIEKQLEKLREQKSNSDKSKNNITDFAENYLVADKDDKKSMQPEPSAVEENLLGKVENFVNHYNSVLSYLNEHREMSNRVSALAANFSTNANLQNSLGSIGISVGVNGELSVDGTKLLTALENNSDAVNALLGSEGLTGNLDKNLNLANYQNQSDQLFPTIDKYSGEEEFEAWENLYSAQTMTTADYARQRAGKILNMFS